MVMPELGDLVVYCEWNMRVPRHISGEVVKVNYKTVRVRWRNTTPQGRPMHCWYRGRDQLIPEFSLVAHGNLDLVERKGGPW